MTNTLENLSLSDYFIILTWIKYILQQDICGIFASHAATFQKRKSRLHNWKWYLKTSEDLKIDDPV